MQAWEKEIISCEAYWHGLRHKADCRQRSCDERENGDYNNSRMAKQLIWQIKLINVCRKISNTSLISPGDTLIFCSIYRFVVVRH